jgi:hypothetical protein
MKSRETLLRRCFVWRWVFGLMMLVPLSELSAAPDVQPESDERVVSVDPTLCAEMRTRHVLAPESPVGCERLKLVRFGYFGFDGELHNNGQIIVLDAVADHVLHIFRVLRAMKFPIAKAKLMNQYDGNDDRSMADNNTSAFNVRKISGTNAVSMHSYGLAIDINPVQNPYAKRSGASLQFSPPAGVEFANRLDDRPWVPRRPGMAELIVDLFANDGFLVWGGYWTDPIDYQHFQVTRTLAEQLVRLAPAEATSTFENYVQSYRNCINSADRRAPADRVRCIMEVNKDDQPSND